MPNALKPGFFYGFPWFVVQHMSQGGRIFFSGQVRAFFFFSVSGVFKPLHLFQALLSELRPGRRHAPN